MPSDLTGATRAAILAVLVTVTATAAGVVGSGVDVGAAPARSPKCPAQPVSRPGADLRHSEIPVVGVQADLGCADLTGATLDGVDLTQANLAGAKLAGASLVGTKLGQVHLEGADLSKAHLQRADLSQATATGARFIDADLSGASAVQTRFDGADLTGANLTDVTLDQADLSGADLSHADVSGATLLQADLTDATLDGMQGTPRTLRWAAFLSGAAGLLIIGLAAWGLVRRFRRATATDGADTEVPGTVSGMPIYGVAGVGTVGMGGMGRMGPPSVATVVGVMAGAVATGVGVFLMVTGLVGTVMEQLSPLATVAGAPVIGRFAVSPTCLVFGSLLFTAGIIVRSFSSRLL